MVQSTAFKVYCYNDGLKYSIARENVIVLIGSLWSWEEAAGGTLKYAVIKSRMLYGMRKNCYTKGVQPQIIIFSPEIPLKRGSFNNFWRICVLKVSRPDSDSSLKTGLEKYGAGVHSVT
jgi:hypothetical protein